MNATELCFLAAGQLSKLISGKEVSPVEVAEAHLARVSEMEPALNSFITVTGEAAMAAARQAERDIMAGRYLGPLHGVPFALKDIYYVAGVRNTSGSRIFDQFVPPYDSTVAARFKKAGGILLGKLNLHQFAYGPTGENPDYGDMHNPWDTDCIAGGSSGGSGAATAAGQCTLTMGTDTGGSIRIPAGLCGIVGLKPTYGRLSRHGITTLSWSMDHAGPMVRSVEDAALIMNALAGHDTHDPTSATAPVPDFTKALTGDIRGLRVGVPREFFEVPLDPEVKAAVRKAIELLEYLGASVTEVSWPMFHQAAAISSVILMSEATAYHRDLLRSRGAELAPSVRLRLEAGLFFSAADYVKAQQARTLFNHQSLELLRQVDVLAGPTLPVAACKLGTAEIQVGNTRQGVIPTLTQFSRPFNINGFPAITVPCGFSSPGLPIGLQLAGRPFDEETVLRAAHAYEQATPWHQRRPTGSVII
ncbi:MAG: amidase [Dehalococcoidia bacterium]|nr:amidase [Dehalococcoidia bacterium]